MGSFWQDLNVAERDQLAWQVICDWPRLSDVQTQLRGLDFDHLTRWFLWDKVGRAIRRDVDPAGFAIEVAASRLRHGEAPAVMPPRRASLVERVVYKKEQATRHWRRYGRQRELAVRRRAGSTRVLYCPFPYSRHARLIRPLIDGLSPQVAIVVPATTVDDWPGAYPDRQRTQPAESDEAFGRQLIVGICDGLRSLHVELLPDDVTMLRQQIHQQLASVNRIERVLSDLRPDAIWVPADNHPPFVDMVLVARREGIPTVMMQHGLDCERYYLDEAYASHIATWGAARQERYQEQSDRQPIRIAVTGNPHYDGMTPPAGLAESDDIWLWVTRPHRSEKCYAPSRSVLEGTAILDALLQALAEAPTSRLLIKAHGFDDSDRYVEQIQARGLSDRAQVIDDRIVDLLQQASIVITEDSTAGMDAMVAGKRLIHAHLAASEPVMNFAACGAALPATSREAIVASLPAIRKLSEADCQRMALAQREFLQAHAGLLDGRSSQRFVEFVNGVVGG
ncbi:MAG: UDP-N-acetylglucosamine 2-epimerase [Verrucomicrobia bacterium]|nr:UDP-N-acetylglucosamine 2-epimerase [Verrucomicrobiota bacterium]